LFFEFVFFMAHVYRDVGLVLDKVMFGKIGIKDAVFGPGGPQSPRAAYGLASKVLAHQRGVRAALELLKDADIGSRGVASAMIYDLVVNRRLHGGGALKRLIQQNQQSVEDVYRLAESCATISNERFANVRRYVRVNLTRIPTDRSERFLRKAVQKLPQSEALDLLKDPHVAGLFSFPSSWSSGLATLKEVLEGDLILQDKSSCLAAICSGAKPGDVVVDACAAPGSKTAHLLQCLGGKGKLIACERNPRRAAVLARRLRLLCGIEPAEKVDELCLALESGTPPASAAEFWAGDVRVHIVVGDFLAQSPQSQLFHDADVIVVDPSCSGTGLPSHAASSVSAPSQVRLRKLADFQAKILSHALQFPKARTVCYSTCSMLEPENEGVVQRCLNSFWDVVQPLPSWDNGPTLPTKDVPIWASRLIRCNPEVHLCRGFFLARLDRCGNIDAGAICPVVTRKRSAVVAVGDGTDRMSTNVGIAMRRIQMNSAKKRRR